MATPTYTAIASITLGSSASSVTFSSIPQDYRDLVLVVDGLIAGAAYNPYIQINGDGGSNYNWVLLGGDGSSFSSGSSSSTNTMLIGASSNTGRGNILINFLDYSATDKHKPVLTRNADALSPSGQAISAWAGRWANTNAITSFSIVVAGGRLWNATTTFSLWGIAS